MVFSFTYCTAEKHVGNAGTHAHKKTEESLNTWNFAFETELGSKLSLHQIEAFD